MGTPPHSTIRTTGLRVPGAAYLWLSIGIIGASTSIVRILVGLGQDNLIEGRNPISFCNVLCAGNLCALLVLVPLYREHLAPARLATLAAKDWWTLGVLALLMTALAPALTFTAVSYTMVTSVVLLGQLSPPLMLALSWIVFGERSSTWCVAGAVLALVGVGLSVMLQPMTDGFMFGKGEVYAALAAITYAVSTLIARPTLQRIPLGLRLVVRNAVGTVVFFIIAVSLYGAEHFIDLTAPVLWRWMLLYGVVIVVGGQLAFFTGIRSAPAAAITLATSCQPIAGVLAAFLILGEQPLRAHIIGGAVLLAGIAVGQFGLRKHTAAAPAHPSLADGSSATCEAVARVGFKGV